MNVNAIWYPDQTIEFLIFEYNWVSLLLTGTSSDAGRTENDIPAELEFQKCHF